MPPSSTESRPSRQLIVNADDFGMSEGVNWAVEDAHTHGIVTAASLLANGDGFDDAVERAHRLPGLDIGVHLNVSMGRALGNAADVASLCGDDGSFRPWLSVIVLSRLGRIRRYELEAEWTRQIQRIVEAGITPTHLDSHHHLHILPGFFEVAAELARRFGIPFIRVPLEPPHGLALSAPDGLMRLVKLLGANVFSLGLRQRAREAGLRTTDHFRGNNLTSVLHEETLLDFVETAEDGLTELACHPGRGPGDTHAMRLRNRFWHREQAALTNPELRAALLGDVTLTRFSEIS